VEEVRQWHGGGGALVVMMDNDARRRKCIAARRRKCIWGTEEARHPRVEHARKARHPRVEHARKATLARTDGTQHTRRGIGHWHTGQWRRPGRIAPPLLIHSYPCLSLLCGLTLNLDGLWGSGH